MKLYSHYNRSLKDFARENRSHMTKAEASLWKYALRAKKRGFTFNRQRPVDKYIADFMCKKLNLIIEVDGISHHSKEAMQRDEIRQRRLEDLGFTVIRFSDEEVLSNIIGVIRVIDETIQELRPT